MEEKIKTKIEKRESRLELWKEKKIQTEFLEEKIGNKIENESELKIGRRLSCSAKDVGGTVAGYGGRSMTGHGASKKRRKRAIKKEKK